MISCEEGCLTGRHGLVTGASSGIGRATALRLAELGAELTIVARDRGRGEAVLDELTAAGRSRGEGSGQCNHRLELVDLSSMRACAALAERVASRGPLDLLVNCAGVFKTRREMTPEGLETQFAVNHLASFVLTRGLVPTLEASGRGRVIVVSSDSHRPGRIHWKDPSLKAFYFGLHAYEQSKLANVLFVKELARRRGSGSALGVFAVDPGLVDTAMGNKAGFSPSSLVWSLRRRAGSSPRVPAEAIAWLSSQAGLEGRSGGYWKDGREIEASARALDAEAAARLWSLSESLVDRALRAG